MAVLPTPCLIGPTGSGKSEVALHLARTTKGEVIACDAFSVYRGMSLLTAAPTPPEDVSHHLVACRDPSEPWSAAAFVQAADRIVDGARERGAVPWIVGGSALYLRCWLKGLGAPVPRDPVLRAELLQEAARRGSPALHERLARLDPDRAAEVHPNDTRRIVRALEIIRVTGRPASAQRSQWAGPDRRPALLFGLRRGAEDLDERIRRRTKRMFASGVVEEARRLLDRPLSPEARKVLGLDVLARHLAGETDAAEAEEEIARRTRRFARKQRTFFASFARVHWVDVGADAPPDATAARVRVVFAEAAPGP